MSAMIDSASSKTNNFKPLASLSWEHTQNAKKKTRKKEKKFEMLLPFFVIFSMKEKFPLNEFQDIENHPVVIMDFYTHNHKVLSYPK